MPDAMLSPPPEHLFDAEHRPHLGRFLAPIAHPDLPAPRWRLKEWHYTSLCTDRFFLAFAVVQLGYLANAFCYFVDRRAPTRFWQTEAIAPFGRGLQFAPSSVNGTTLWRRGGDRLEVRAVASGWQVELDIGLDGERLTGAFAMQADQALALVHPLAPQGDPRRIAYTHKAAGLRAQGELKFAGETHGFDDALATVDWTRSHALRTTQWKWASLVHFLPDGRRLGLNLSALVYDGPDGASRENAVWLDGQVHCLGAVQFAVPDQPIQQPWRLRGDDIDLTFQPLGGRQQHLELGILSSRFVQPYGTFTGTLRVGGEVLDMVQAFGVVEDHRSRW